MSTAPSTSSKSPEAALKWEVLDGSIALVTFDQPNSRANTLNQAVLGEFEKLLGQLNQRKDLKGLILRSGKPGMFIAGADLRELGSRPDPALGKAVTQRGLKIIAGLEALPYPTAAAIEGSCMGGGLEVALGLDFRLASSHAKTELGFPEVKIGLFPGWGGTQRLTRLIGPSLSAEIICSGEPVSAERARQLGIVFDVVPSERLLDEARRILQWAQESGAWREARRRKQQPIGLTEEQLTFAIAVARAQIMEK